MREPAGPRVDRWCLWTHRPDARVLAGPSLVRTGVPGQEGLGKVAWLPLVVLTMLWVALLSPTIRRNVGRPVPQRTVEDFERGMDLLAQTESGGGRWIVTPGKGTTFIGSRARARARARDRRRRILVVLIDCLVLSALIGLAPPLRAAWYLTAILLVALGAYVWLLLSMKHRHQGPSMREVAAPAQVRPARHRFAADASGRTPRAAYNGLSMLTDDPSPIVVRSAST